VEIPSAAGLPLPRERASNGQVRYSTSDHHNEGTPPMNQATPNTPPPDDETTSTLYRFCLSHGLSLDHIERSAEGIELSKVARERQLPLIRVRERIEHQWIKSRLYPVSFLNEWLARYTQAQAEATPAAPSPEAQPTAANG